LSVTWRLIGIADMLVEPLLDKKQALLYMSQSMNSGSCLRCLNLGRGFTCFVSVNFNGIVIWLNR
ncbi:MAG: hypothetical protein NZ961_19305, partial [Candidatus Poribacteria bacterium]|nr:hypothetical protein [Candidatus Poribacteria bacterium]